MKCTDARAALPLLIHGEPSPQEQTELSNHLAGCPDCRREHEALQSVRRLLDAVPVPRVEVDLPRLYQSAADRQMRRLRRWRRAALLVGTIAALLLIVAGLRLQIRLQSGQMVVCWGDPPPPVGQAFQPDAPVGQAFQPDAPVGQAFQPDAAVADSQAGKPDLQEELRVLSELIHALKQDVEDRDERLADRLDRLQKHVQTLQAQADLRWNATEQDVTALYLLTRKGENP